MATLGTVLSWSILGIMVATLLLGVWLPFKLGMDQRDFSFRPTIRIGGYVFGFGLLIWGLDQFTKYDPPLLVNSLLLMLAIFLLANLVCFPGYLFGRWRRKRDPRNIQSL